MIKREKVVEGLRHCTSHNDGRDKFGGVGKCGGCPYYGHDCTDRMKKDALALLKEQPQIVRCKDCKYYDYHNGCMSWHDVNSNNDNWYCADGERRTDDA